MRHSLIFRATTYQELTLKGRRIIVTIRMDKSMPLAQNLGELKKTSYKPKTIKKEIRDNLIKKLSQKEPIFPGIVGYDKTVIPQIINALLSGHDFILLGLRGQAKSKILRQLVTLLDEFIPALEGTPLNEDPLAPLSPKAKKIIEQQGDNAKIKWISREERYQEKLATPDVSIADLIGDIDPIKAAREKLDIGNEEVIHWGIVPRSNRGIFAINELPDLQARIQVGLFNILEEKDIQVRGFPIRVPLDMLMVFSANPEDYTNRGSIITPLKDRIASQIITHYPNTLEDAMTITKSQIDRKEIPFTLPDWILRILEDVSFQARASEYIDQASGVSARVSISALENLISNVERRSILTGEKPHVRLMDLYSIIPGLTGKMELVHEGDQQGPVKVARLLIGQAINSYFLKIFPKPPKKGKEEPDQIPKPHAYSKLLESFGDGLSIKLNDESSQKDYHTALDQLKMANELIQKHAKPESTDESYLYLELLLEGLYSHQYLSRKEQDGKIEFVDLFASMFKNLKG